MKTQYHQNCDQKNATFAAMRCVFAVALLAVGGLVVSGCNHPQETSGQTAASVMQIVHQASEWFAAHQLRTWPWTCGSEHST